MVIPLSNIHAVAKERLGAVVDFAQQIIRVPSLPGQEGDVAALIRTEMELLGYDKVWVDEAGNVVGKIEGGNGPAILLNGHMDHVDPGSDENWPYPPFSGQIVGDDLWGRASVDMKGPVACMVYAASLFKQIGIVPPGPIFVTVAVMEETGGLGTQHLTSYLNPAAAICGEPSRNILRRGHRGRVEVVLTVKGRPSHASVPHLAINPHYLAAAVLAKLPALTMVEDTALGISTVAPTLYATDQRSPNVIPGEVQVTLDWRTVPAETPENIIAKLQALVSTALAEDEMRDRVLIEIRSQQFVTYTGVVKVFPSIFPPYILAEDDLYLRSAQAALIEALGRDDGIDIWRFATDGGHLMSAGIPTIGFGPGDERLAHTNQECISLAQMEEAVIGYMALTLALADAAR